MKRLFVFVPAMLLVLLLLNSFVLKEKYAGEKTTEVPKPGNNKPAQAKMVYKSIDGGKTWKDISEGLPEPVIDVYGAGRNDFFADENGLWITTGNGLYHNTSNSAAPFWTKVLFPEEHSNIAHGKAGIYAYNNWGSGIFQKANGTGVWSPVFTNLQAKRVSSVFETAEGTIFIGTDRGLFKSINSGKSWKQLKAGVGGEIAESNGVLLATSQGGILRSTNEGESWELVISDGGVGIDVERIEGGFAAINYSTAAKTRRIRASYDGGKTWQPIDAGFPGHSKEFPLPSQEYKTSIIQVAENFFCGHTDGIYSSSDKGKTWKLLVPAVKGKMFKLSVSGNVIYAVQMESHC